MDITPLDIELVRQTSGSNCVKACVQMVLNYYEFEYKKREIKGGIHAYKKHSGLLGTYIQDVGVYLLKKGFKPQISHYDWGWWGEDQAEAASEGKRQLVKSLEDLKSDKDWAEKRIVDKDIKFIERGGMYNLTQPQLVNIDASVMKKIPVILLVQAECFYHNPALNLKHAVLIIGKKESDYIIRDPLYAIDKIKEDELHYAWSNAGGWILTFPPKKSHKSKQEQLGF